MVRYDEQDATISYLPGKANLAAILKRYDDTPFTVSQSSPVTSIVRAKGLTLRGWTERLKVKTPAQPKKEAKKGADKKVAATPGPPSIRLIVELTSEKSRKVTTPGLSLKDASAAGVALEGDFADAPNGPNTGPLTTRQVVLLHETVQRRAGETLVPLAFKTETTDADNKQPRTIKGTLEVVLQTPKKKPAPTTLASRTGVALVGGTLLNRNLAFIDEINTLVYPAGRMLDGGQGTATIFLDDVRISTNVRLFEDVRALGTRVSAAVRARVLGEGQVWLDRAFVVNDWYVSAYEPIVDTFGDRVGMLYVGFLEAPYKAAERQTLFRIFATLVIVLAISVPVLLRWAQGIFAPLERMNAAIGKVEKGDLGARTGIVAADDEIGRVASHLDSLLDQLQERDRALRDLNEELEARVKDRTRDLEEANRQIEVTTRQLIVSEKLASIGEITAGVAHEINNPLAVIQGNLDVVREDLGPRAEPLRTEFTLIQEQIQAIHILVSKLLHFARPEEYADTGSGNDPDTVIRDTMPLVQHLLSKSRIEVDLDLEAGVTVAMNHTELQQVLINLMVNAIQAMPEGGRLTLRTRREAAKGRPMVRISVNDTGTGMSPEVLGRIFDPFFTTKRSEGTGLGLSISRNLVTRGGGTITAESTPGQGTRFDILLPVFEADGQAL